MKYKLTGHAIDVMTSRGITIEWIERAVESPSFHTSISDFEEHFFKTIEEVSNWCLKVVVNPTSMKIVTAYFDRNMRKKGCKDEN
ncbi:DUF4258 domain-containing protein [Sulfurospirillum multivorans]|uniref:DUF4258 domain-containing protein n=1 Tax=Sulfurospirillum multivorans (strain DM 12446 / JCM 15788 / NBRC 109480) TaxID=1150621 RepID=A0AA86DYR2_SULMK|nr:DUF4258 domain-containing protein [Sulfurospirillum multivorans]AHJ11905.1 hypothetical protein SMUL_0630 [Sulfurospirillum multivorans DSM 12446]